MKNGNPIKRLLFNMVEVVVALVIVMVALIGVMGMIPHGIEASYDAQSRASAADVADQFLHYMSMRIDSDWDETTAFPDDKTDSSSSDMVFSSKNMLSESNLRIAFEAPNELTEWDPATCNTGVFRVSQLTGASVVDFRSEVRVWKQIVEYKKDFTTPGTTVTRTTTPPANIPESEVTIIAGAIWAGGLIRAIGNNVTIPGGHSNGDLSIGKSVTVTDSFTFVGSADMKGGQTATKVTSQKPPSLPRTIDEYKALAKAAGTYFTSGVELQNGAGGTIYLKAQKVKIPNNSIVFVDGADIVVKQKNFDRKATLISTGSSISLNANDLTIEPAVDDVLAWCSGGDIHMMGNNLSMKGISRTSGSVHFNGNSGTVLDGSLWADGDVQINGNTMEIKGSGGGAGACDPKFVADFAADNRSVRANASCPIEELELTFCDGSKQTFTGLTSKSVPAWGTGANDLKRIEKVKITTDCGKSDTIDNSGVDCSEPDDKGSPGKDMTGRSLVCILNAEVSWPADVPYDKRKKVVYRSEVAKPAEIIEKE